MSHSKWLRRVQLLAAFGGFAVAGLALAGSPRGGDGRGSNPPSVCGGRDGGGGNDIPTPFSVPNRRVELANGEIYQLVGYVVFVRDQAYFAVDLDAQPWLANAARRDSPLYALEGPRDVNWRSLSGKRVEILAEAHGQIVENLDGNPQYEISLSLLTGTNGGAR